MVNIRSEFDEIDIRCRKSQLKCSLDCGQCNGQECHHDSPSENDLEIIEDLETNILDNKNDDVELEILERPEDDDEEEEEEN
ncbi:hypothetical protein FQA39_LY14647 [Lamprigera yunnana]|nr:hypothetical protein FQA39_LY14647 [Lamprigera yunnana]